MSDTDQLPEHVTADKSEVNVPEWADIYEVGDTIRWTSPDVKDGKTMESRVIGFSSSPRPDMNGRPAIRPWRDDDNGTTSVAVGERFHIPPEEESPPAHAVADHLRDELESVEQQIASLEAEADQMRTRLEAIEAQDEE